MRVSEQVRFQEEKIDAFEKRDREEIEKELRSDETGIRLDNLTRYDWAPKLKDHFYSIKIFKTGRGLGLILPFRRLIFHSLHSRLILGSSDEKLMNVLSEFSDRRGYNLEYHEYAWRHEPIIEGLLEYKLPKGVFPDKHQRQE